MPFQVPKTAHPWRTWRGEAEKDRGEGLAKPVKGEKLNTTGIKPVRILLEEIVGSWEMIEIVTSAYGREGRWHLTELSQERIAAWLSGLLRRNYAA